MQVLLDRLDEIDSSPPITVETLSRLPAVLHSSDDNDNSDIAFIYEDTVDFFEALMQSVRAGHLSPSRKHGPDLSQLVECVLYVCGRQPHNHQSDRAPFVDSVLKVLKVDWNLDVSHQHYERAIAFGCASGNWNRAAKWFEDQIDPNAGGTPVVISVENPLGLYAIAKRCQEFETNTKEPDAFDRESDSLPSMVAEHVMDAVQKMVMVSPSDQASYILAAGNALGHAGAWRELDDYRQSTLLASNYGRPLTGACLWACCLGGNYSAGLRILKEEILPPSLAKAIETSGIDGAAALLEEEWQWGGARDRMDPLCRDLAMQVIGGTSVVGHAYNTDDDDDGDLEDRQHYNSNLALELFRQSRKEGVTISKEALLGVVEACERDKDWKNALWVLRILLDEHAVELNTKTNLAPWVVPGSHLEIVERDGVPRDNAIQVEELGSVLASVMRNCNQTSSFGMSLFALQLFRTELLEPSPSKEKDIPGSLSSPEADIEELLLRLASTDSHPSESFYEVLTASMVALSGLRCHEQAMKLYETVVPGQQHHGGNASAASVAYGCASLHQKKSGTLLLGNPWTSAHKHMDRLFQAKTLVQRLATDSETTVLSRQRREGMEEILARAMNSCTSAHQPELSLYLLEWMQENVFMIVNESSSEETYGDSLTAENILARRWTQDFTGAIELFESILEKHAEDDLVQWRQTISAGLMTMVANGRGNDAVRVFEALDGKSRSTDCYTTIGRHLSKVKDWKELIDLYRDASVEGYSSEELSMLAMLAVTSTKVDNRLRMLRAIVDDCAMKVGLDSKRWTMTKYWTLKRTLGFYHARLLMWWNDEKRAPLDEANLAIKEFYLEKANGMRPKNDVVRAILSSASQYDSLGLDYTDGYEKVPRSEDDWAALIEDVLHTIHDSPIRYDPSFVDSVVQAYKYLGRSRECVEYASNVIEIDGTRMRRSTLAEVSEAAQIEHADGLYNDIQMLLSRGNLGGEA